jgi:hypothetical protein
MLATKKFVEEEIKNTLRWNKPSSGLDHLYQTHLAALRKGLEHQERINGLLLEYLGLTVEHVAAHVKLVKKGGPEKDGR